MLGSAKQQPTLRRPQVGEPFPDLTLRGLDGQPFPLRTLRGRRSLIFMWASW
jgi:peroxiredoxin